MIAVGFMHSHCVVIIVPSAFQSFMDTVLGQLSHFLFWDYLNNFLLSFLVGEFLFSKLEHLF